MSKSLIAALALIACSLSSQTLAQSPGAAAADNGRGAATPTLILPNTLTSPLTRGSDTEGHAATLAGGEASDATSELPHSVPGEEALDPDTN